MRKIRFDSPIPEQDGGSVGTDNVKAVKSADPTQETIELGIFNESTGTQKLYLGFGQKAISGKGIPLNPGEAYWASSDDSFPVWQGDVWVLSSAAGGAYSIFVRRVQH